MNIAILDFTLSKTHIRLNISNFNALKQFANLYIVNTDGYYDELASEKNVTLFRTKIGEKKKSRNSFSSRLSVIDNIRINSHLFKQYRDVKFDAIIIMGYEVIVSCLMRLFIPRNIPTYIFEHQQLDEMKHPLKRFFFAFYKNKLSHIVYEEKYKQYMEKELKVKRVFVIPYIGYVNADVLDKEEHQQTLYLGISANNDEQIIDSIIVENNEKKLFSGSGYSAYIRSKKHSYKDDNLFVGYEYLSSEQYDNLFQKAYAVLALVPPSFVNRMSGPLMDALLSGKRVITSNKDVYLLYKEQCPSVIKYFNTIDELRAIINEDNWVVNKKDVDYIRKIHSMENVCAQYKIMLGYNE